MSAKNNQMDDPRNSALETPFVLPKTWHREAGGSSYLFGLIFHRSNCFIDGASSSGMFLSGLIMVTRNR